MRWRPRQPLDFVATVCDSASETCPVFSGDVKRLAFEDPAALKGHTKSGRRHSGVFGIRFVVG